MSDRVSQFVLLCEDVTHEQLAKAYLKKCRYENLGRLVRPRVASREQHGGNVGWVLNEFPKELHACRQRQKKSNTLLIVLVDADTFTVADRRRQLLERLKAAGYEGFGEKEPAVLLIPKRHVETWICALLGDSVSEEEDCKSRDKSKKQDIRQAAETLFNWSRAKATPGPTCVSSLKTALPEWRKIG